MAPPLREVELLNRLRYSDCSRYSGRRIFPRIPNPNGSLEADIGRKLPSRICASDIGYFDEYAGNWEGRNYA
jgi:hypothetical protein